ncbi:PREDICTED: F-box/kelch-repeat protein At3g04660-like [Camelina sativa]|uniref:F-box/kelch-repeat protein At3g04660-like n=1 Tax=Camelina sativa TaxID=90675 RepID=A0ABM0W4T9_CAMSA|nr:PREDICTED: F-box/kelch-repeat protein At3g04660-like [Camelina sativa]
MIRLGSKERRCNTSPPLTRSQTYPLERIPLEMKEEILMKLKGKCISKFISISKSWSSIMRSKRFTNLYLNRSLARPRILFSLTHHGDNERQLFYSCSQEDPSSDHQTEHQVFTLGARRKKWRKIECNHPHYTPRRTQGLCSNGVVYYLAWIQLDLSLICFDVRSEKFSLIELPNGGNVQYLSHYGEKIAAVNMLVPGTLDLWVLEDTNKPHWSDVSIMIPSWTDSYGQFEFFTLRGRLGTGELVLAPVFVIDPFFILCYDLKEKKARKIQIEGIETHSTYIHVYLDHVESPMFLEL